MNYDALFAPFDGQSVRVGLVGAGEFGATLLAQARSIEALTICAVCERQPQRAVDVLKASGYDPARVAVCGRLAEARTALTGGKIAVVTDGRLLAELELDIVVEATGDAEAATVTALAAIEAGKHVAMVTKEADCVIGPGLQARAAAQDRVFTSVDGDQPSLLIGLVSWARRLGLDIGVAGKSSEYDFVFDAETERVTCRDRQVEAKGLGRLWSPVPDELREAAERRAQILDGLPTRSVSDLCELCVVANATGLRPDTAALHAPILRTQEVPSLLRPAAEGGLMAGHGVLDIFNCLRQADEISFAGGVFLVVACGDLEAWRVLGAKGIPIDHDGRHALLYNPQHLLGVEAPITLLTAALLGQPSGALAARPVCDLAAQTAIDLEAGQVLSVTDAHKHEVGSLRPLLLPSAPLAGSSPIPYYMAVGCRLAEAVPAGTTLTLDMVEAPASSALWDERRRQDALFCVESVEG